MSGVISGVVLVVVGNVESVLLLTVGASGDAQAWSNMPIETKTLVCVYFGNM